MRKTLIALTITLLLSACGSGNSGNANKTSSNIGSTSTNEPNSTSDTLPSERSLVSVVENYTTKGGIPYETTIQGYYDGNELIPHSEGDDPAITIKTNNEDQVTLSFWFKDGELSRSSGYTVEGIFTGRGDGDDYISMKMLGTKDQMSLVETEDPESPNVIIREVQNINDTDQYVSISHWMKSENEYSYKNFDLFEKPILFVSLKDNKPNRITYYGGKKLHEEWMINRLVDNVNNNPSKIKFKSYLDNICQYYPEIGLGELTIDQDTKECINENTQAREAELDIQASLATKYYQ